MASSQEVSCELLSSIESAFEEFSRHMHAVIHEEVAKFFADSEAKCGPPVDTLEMVASDDDDAEFMAFTTPPLPIPEETLTDAAPPPPTMETHPVAVQDAQLHHDEIAKPVVAVPCTQIHCIDKSTAGYHSTASLRSTPSQDVVMATTEETQDDVLDAMLSLDDVRDAPFHLDAEADAQLHLVGVRSAEIQQDVVSPPTTTEEILVAVPEMQPNLVGPDQSKFVSRLELTGPVPVVASFEAEHTLALTHRVFDGLSDTGHYIIVEHNMFRDTEPLRHITTTMGISFGKYKPGYAAAVLSPASGFQASSTRTATKESVLALPRATTSAAPTIATSSDMNSGTPNTCATKCSAGAVNIVAAVGVCAVPEELVIDSAYAAAMPSNVCSGTPTACSTKSPNDISSFISPLPVYTIPNEIDTSHHKEYWKPDPSFHEQPSPTGPLPLPAPPPRWGKSLGGRHADDKSDADDRRGVESAHGSTADSKLHAVQELWESVDGDDPAVAAQVIVVTSPTKENEPSTITMAPVVLEVPMAKLLIEGRPCDAKYYCSNVCVLIMIGFSATDAAGSLLKAINSAMEYKVPWDAILGATPLADVVWLPFNSGADPNREYSTGNFDMLRSLPWPSFTLNAACSISWSDRFVWNPPWEFHEDNAAEYVAIFLAAEQCSCKKLIIMFKYVAEYIFAAASLSSLEILVSMIAEYDELVLMLPMHEEGNLAVLMVYGYVPGMQSDLRSLCLVLPTLLLYWDTDGGLPRCEVAVLEVTIHRPIKEAANDGYGQQGCKIRDGVSAGLQVCSSSLHSSVAEHRLGGKPNLKEGRMSWTAVMDVEASEETS